MTGPSTPALTGTPKQVEWGERIRREMGQRGLHLPAVPDARFWIDHARDCKTADQLAEAARAFLIERDANFESPFTETFPRHNRVEATPALEGLKRLSESTGVVVLDLETTGLQKTDRVVEIAAVRWPARDVLIDTLIYPPNGLWPSAVSAITIGELVAGAWLFEEMAADVARWAGEHHLVSWNSRFDMPFLRREIVAVGLPAPTIRATCAMRLAGGWLELDGWPTLDEALERLGLDRGHLGEAHRAMADVLATCAVLDAMAGEGGEDAAAPGEEGERG